MIALRAAAGQITVDGSLREWPDSFSALGGEGDQASVQFAYDDRALYLAAEVADDRVLRGSRDGKGVDDAVLVHAFVPRSGDTAVTLHPGSGKIPALARIQGVVSKDVAVVEGPRGGASGYVLEARIPWSLFAGADNRHLMELGVRIADVDDAATKAGKGQLTRRLAPGPLWLEGTPAASLPALLHKQDLQGSRPRLDAFADVAGDGRLERLLVVGTFAIVVAADRPLRFVSLPASRAADVLSADAVEVFERGKAGLQVTVRQPSRSGTRTLLMIYRFVEAQPSVALSIEVGREAGGQSVASEVVLPRRDDPSIVVVLDDAGSLPEEALREEAPPGVVPLLTALGTHARSTYRWTGDDFEVVHEALKPTKRRRTSSEVMGDPEPPAAVVTQVMPTEEALIAAFREQRGHADTRPRFQERINLAEDGRRELLMVVDRDLAVFGDGFQGGHGFFYFTLPAGAAGDVLHLFTADVTGDGRREIFVRLREHIGDVSRDVLHAFTFEGGSFSNLVSVEVRRARGESAVSNRVKVVPVQSHYALLIEPGVARGWDEDSYPFSHHEAGPYGVLLLPFGDRPVRYRYEGGKLLPMPVEH